MFKFIDVEFPDAVKGPKVIFEARLYQKINEHEMLSVKFRDWNISYEYIKPGTAAKFNIMGSKSSREFIGYVHHIQPSHTPGTAFTEVVFIGGTFPLKQASQKVYKNITASNIVTKIAKIHGLAAFVVPTKRVFEMVSHAAHTDWELLVRLAKQHGYTLRAHNTELYFEPILNDYATYRAVAPYFAMRSESNPQGSTLYSFKPLISDSLEIEGAFKAAVAVSGVDKGSKKPTSITQQKRNKKTKSIESTEMFDRFDTKVVAPSVEIAKFEAEAAEARNSFPYRATAEVLGEPNIRPNLPIYIDGVGTAYNGFWTVLGTEHIMIETQREIEYKYTTLLHLGTDSLGLATRWTDGSAVQVPDTKQKRVITPGKKQTVVKPKSKIVKNNKAKNSRTSVSFGKINNRPKPTSVVSASLWKTATPKLTSTTVVKRRSPSVVKRLKTVK